MPDVTSIRGSRGGARAPKAKFSKTSSSSSNFQSKIKGPCFDWNAGSCRVGFECPRGFTHTCRGCGGTHRETDCTKSNGSKGKNNSKSKGKGQSSKGKGKGSKF